MLRHDKLQCSLKLKIICTLMQIKTAHPLAITYNDQSPLENHHHAAAVRLLLQPEYRYLPVSPLPFTISVHHDSLPIVWVYFSWQVWPETTMRVLQQLAYRNLPSRASPLPKHCALQHLPRSVASIWLTWCNGILLQGSCNSLSIGIC